MTDKIVARVTRYTAVEADVPLPQISEQHPVWVMGDPIESVNYDIVNEDVLIASAEQVNALLDESGEIDIGLCSPSDKWEIVLPDEWPDEVLVALTAKLLLGAH